MFRINRAAAVDVPQVIRQEAAQGHGVALYCIGSPLKIQFFHFGYIVGGGNHLMMIILRSTVCLTGRRVSTSVIEFLPMFPCGMRLPSVSNKHLWIPKCLNPPEY